MQHRLSLSELKLPQHSPLQQTSGSTSSGSHATPQSPQFSTSTNVFLHSPSQQSWSGSHGGKQLTHSWVMTCPFVVPSSTGASSGQLHPCGHVAVAVHDPANALTVPFSSSSVDNAWNAGGQGSALQYLDTLPIIVGSRI